MLSQDATSAGRGVSWAFGGNPALFLGACEDALAVLVPAVVELALVLVGPFLHDVVRAVDAPLAQYMKNGLSGSNALCLRSQLMASSARSSLRW